MAELVGCANRPESRWIFASYSADLSVKHSVDRRAVIQSDWYQSLCSQCFELTSDQNEKAEFTNNGRGLMFATSVGGSVTGRGRDFIVVDDRLNPRQAESETYREEAVRFLNETLMTQFDDLERGAIVVIMHRLHERDLVGQLLERGGWQLLRLPAEAELQESFTLPMGGRLIERAPGDLLWPERFSREALEEQKRALGSYAYARQYQQRPSPAEGGIIKRSWWRYYHEIPAHFDKVIQSWDCTFEAAIDSHFRCRAGVGEDRAEYVPFRSDKR